MEPELMDVGPEPPGEYVENRTSNVESMIPALCRSRMLLGECIVGHQALSPHALCCAAVAAQRVDNVESYFNMSPCVYVCMCVYVCCVLVL